MSKFTTDVQEFDLSTLDESFALKDKIVLSYVDSERIAVDDRRRI